MVLLIECILVCTIFGYTIVFSTLHHKTDWLNEYAPEVQEEFLKSHPDYVPSRRTKNTLSFVITKLIACLILLVLLSILVYLAGAKSFLSGFIDAYIIWTVVNLFDLFVLDMGIFAYWKKVRLPGTEHMDKAYHSNKWKSTKGAIVGVLIGLPVCLLCGLIIMLITK